MVENRENAITLKGKAALRSFFFVTQIHDRSTLPAPKIVLRYCTIAEEVSDILGENI